MLAGAGLRLSGEEWPAGRLGAVVLLHGGGQTRHSWSTTASRLAARGYAVLSYDLRGHGESDWHPEGRYALEDHAADLREVLTTISNRCVLVGASLGGLTALEVAADGPPNVAGVVLVDITPKVEMVGMRRIQDFMRARPDGFASLEDAAREVRSYQPTRNRVLNPDGLRKNLRQDVRGRWRWHWDPRVVDLDDAGYDEVRSSSRAAARRLMVPLLLVRGARSDIVSDEGVAELAALTTSLQVVDVRGAGHMVAGDDNDVFTGALGLFLDSVFAADAGGDNQSLLG